MQGIGWIIRWNINVFCDVRCDLCINNIAGDKCSHSRRIEKAAEIISFLSRGTWNEIELMVWNNRNFSKQCVCLWPYVTGEKHLRVLNLAPCYFMVSKAIRTNIPE